MSKSFMELILGNRDENRMWRSFTKRVNALPKEYRFAYKKILSYFNNFGFDMATLIDLLELFEISSSEGKYVIDVIGNDVAAFCDGLIQASNVDILSARTKLNQDVLEYFQMKGE